MFRTTYDRRGQPQTVFDGEFAAKQVALQRTRGDLNQTRQALETAYQRIERARLVNEWRMATINAISNAAQDEHAVAAGHKAALDFLLLNPNATRDQLAQVGEAARMAASKDQALLSKTVEIQTRLRPRGLG